MRYCRLTFTGVCDTKILKSQPLIRKSSPPKVHLFVNLFINPSW